MCHMFHRAPDQPQTTHVKNCTKTKLAVKPCLFTSTYSCTCTYSLHCGVRGAYWYFDIRNTDDHLLQFSLPLLCAARGTSGKWEHGRDDHEFTFHRPELSWCITTRTIAMRSPAMPVVTLLFQMETVSSVRLLLTFSLCRQ